MTLVWMLITLAAAATVGYAMCAILTMGKISELLSKEEELNQKITLLENQIQKLKFVIEQFEKEDISIAEDRDYDF
jgi:hypothetical protein